MKSISCGSLFETSEIDVQENEMRVSFVQKIQIFTKICFEIFSSPTRMLHLKIFMSFTCSLEKSCHTYPRDKYSCIETNIQKTIRPQNKLSGLFINVQ